MSFDSGVRSQRAMRPRSGFLKTECLSYYVWVLHNEGAAYMEDDCSYLNHGLDGEHVAQNVPAWPSVQILPTDGFHHQRVVGASCACQRSHFHRELHAQRVAHLNSHSRSKKTVMKVSDAFGLFLVCVVEDLSV